MHGRWRVADGASLIAVLRRLRSGRILVCLRWLRLCGRAALLWRLRRRGRSCCGHVLYRLLLGRLVSIAAGLRLRIVRIAKGKIIHEIPNELGPLSQRPRQKAPALSGPFLGGQTSNLRAVPFWTLVMEHEQ